MVHIYQGYEENQTGFRRQRNVHPSSEHGGIRLLQGARPSKETARHPREDRLSSHGGEIRFQGGSGEAELERRVGEVKLTQSVEQVSLDKILRMKNRQIN